MEERLDKIILSRGLMSTRTKAEEMIKQVGVLVENKLVTKPGKKFPLDIEIKLIEEESEWVSRAANKLLKAMENWQIDVKDKIAIDIGASTGGFTQVLLSKGIKKVYAVDVGTDQLHEKIKSNNKVVNLEQTHVRILTPQLIPDLTDIIVIDVSFISLEKIFPFIHSFLKPQGIVIALIKPQFELGKENLNKHGVVKNKQLYPSLIEKIKKEALKSNLSCLKQMESPILGGDGNKEFLMLLKKN